MGDRGDRSAIVHELAEQRAEQKYREELRDELRSAAHESLRPMGEQGLSGESSSDDRDKRRKEQHAPPAEREPDQKAKGNDDSDETHGSDLLQEDIQVDRRALADVLAVGAKEGLGGTATFVAQHAKKFPFGVELRRRAEFGQGLAVDQMYPHIGPLASLAMPSVRDLPQQRDHAQLLEQCSIERDLVQPIEDFARRARGPGAFDRIDGYEKRVLRIGLAHERRDRRVSGVAAIPKGLAVDLYRAE